ncbi:hypothetical protein HGRIS_014783 [Hohenbuehelia grisea]|uniref:Uncharacterized protein n=1 Tax=Hohenbuehelia grisea TaxID=104357 RepID=A0ABR3IQU9_9AGAR
MDSASESDTESVAGTVAKKARRDSTLNEGAPAAIKEGEDRTQFLRSLCSGEKQYQRLIDLKERAKPHVHPRLARAAPSWASWEYNKACLPEAFYVANPDLRTDRDSYQALLRWLAQNPVEGLRSSSKAKAQMVSSDCMEQTCLVIGLALRDLKIAAFSIDDPNRGEDIPGYIMHSSFTLADYEHLLKECECLCDLVDPSDEGSSKSSSGPKMAKTASKAKSKSMVTAQGSDVIEASVGSSNPQDSASGAAPAKPHKIKPTPKVAKRPNDVQAGAGVHRGFEPQGWRQWESQGDAVPTGKARTSIAATRKALELGIPGKKLPGALHSLAEVCGAGVPDVNQLGKTWKDLLNRWAELETAYEFAKPGSSKDSLMVVRSASLPTTVNVWVMSYLAKDDFDESKVVNDTVFAEDMSQWWKCFAPSVRAGSTDALLKKDWVKQGGNGLVPLLWGMKIWGRGVVARRGVECAEGKRWLSACEGLSNAFNLVKTAVEKGLPQDPQNTQTAQARPKRVRIQPAHRPQPVAGPSRSPEKRVCLSP